MQSRLAPHLQDPANGMHAFHVELLGYLFWAYRRDAALAEIVREVDALPDLEYPEKGEEV